MAIVRWAESMSVGVSEIDQQHQKLISLINELNDAMARGKGKDALCDVINGLIRYTGTHFKTEESYFDKFNYEFNDSHKKEHSDFVKKVSEFRDSFISGRLGLSMEVMTFLSTWLSKHISVSDRKYCDCFKSNGLT